MPPLTIGTGGSAGDFGPSLVLGGLFGGAFGRAAAVLLDDPTIDPGAFALVGMGTFYGGIAHVPVSSLILVSELAGSYDLLVPLMLSVGMAFIALRRRSLYEAQVPGHAESPVHRPATSLESLTSVLVQTVMHPADGHAVLRPDATIVEMGAVLSNATWQMTFPVVSPDSKLLGMIDAVLHHQCAVRLRRSPARPGGRLMQAPRTVEPTDNLGHAIELLVNSGARQLPVVQSGRVVGFIDESHVTRAHLALLERDRPTNPRAVF